MNLRRVVVTGLGLAHDSTQPPSAKSRAQICVMWGTSAGGIQTLERRNRDLFVKGRPRLSPLSVVMGMNSAATACRPFDAGRSGLVLVFRRAVSA